MPHDWLIEDTQNLYQDSIGWYKKELHHDASDEHVWLKFDGVYMESYLYVNKQLVGTWKNGYTTFLVELSDYLQVGTNELLLKVVHQSPNSRWYTGAGIYRNVWRISTGPVYFLDEDVYLHTEKLEADNWQVEVEVKANIASDYQLTLALLDQDQQQVLVSEELAFNGQQQVTAAFQVADVATWSPAEPNLYTLAITLQDASKQVVQSYRHRLGFKTVELDPEKGMYLNGEKFRIQGVCEHHDLGALGAALNVEVMRQRLLKLKAMGVNAIRTAHNMPAPELMHLADEIGFLIQSEAFDIWRKAKTRYDYSRFFDQYYQEDVTRWIKRDRNHTSLFMWSIGNEIYDTHESEAGLETAQLLAKLVEVIDYKGNAPVTFGSNYLPWPNTQLVADQLKLVGYNYGEKYFDEHHQTYPDWIIYGSETASLVQSRGVYHFPLEASVLADDDEQCSALGNSSTSWGAKSIESLIDHYASKDYALGQFIWTGFDYIGEPTPYHTKNSYFGQIDTAGFEKDTYYMYQAAWTDPNEHPFVHLFPYWDFNPGQAIDVRVASNASEVELFLNGDSLGRKQSAFTANGFVVPTWKAAYIPGELTAIGYDQAGKQIATDSQTSFTESHEIQLQLNKTSLLADGDDTVMLDIFCLDSEGREVKNASNRMNITVTGQGKLIGLDNGDSTDYDQYKGHSKRLFNGKLRAFIQTNNKAGKIEIKVESPGLETAQLELNSQASHLATSSPAVSPAVTVVEESAKQAEQPIRKIELAIANNEKQLTPEASTVQIKATVLPSDASYSDLEWRLVEKNGALTSKASLTQISPSEIAVSAIADGEFKVRCLSKNGSTNYRLISEMDLSVVGFGVDYKDAYQLFSASKTDYQTANVTNGNEKGLATARGEVSLLGYHFVDFGENSVDRIELPIFALDDKPYPIEIYDGHPENEGTQLIMAGVYQKPSRWNVYQNEIFELKQALSKVQQIYIKTYDKMHIKGLLFHKAIHVNKAINITEASFVYGDSFNQLADRIEGIGNNVSIVFEKLQLGEQPIQALQIKGSTPNRVNTILLKFQTDAGLLEHSVEFQQSDDYVLQEFDMPHWQGDGELTFVFLPGSHFNFESIEFVTKSEGNQ